MVENKEHFIKKWKSEDVDELGNIGLGSLLELLKDGVDIKEFDIDLYFKMIDKMIVFGLKR